jgi:hypothetical protein
MACIEKFHVMNSTIGLSPYKPAPTPIPVKPASEMGVSQILFGPYLSYIPFDTLYAPLYYPTSSPMRKTLGSLSISSDIAELIASLQVI